jgi:hypothetical protein
MIDRHVAFAAAGLVVAGEHRNPLQQRRFAGAVLADDDGDGVLEIELEVALQERQAERIGGGISDARSVEPDSLEIRRRQVDRAISPIGHLACLHP